VGLGVVGIVFGALGVRDSFWQVVGHGLLVEIAAMMTGVLLGFLFGIPRSLQAGATQVERRYGVNTNLEQISDWLTKILVGVGLVQLGAIGSKLGAVINTVATGMGGSAPLAGALIIYSLSTGFFGGYLFTRTILTRTFSFYDEVMSRVDSAEQRAKQAEEVSTQTSADVKALTAADAVLAGSKDAVDADTLLALFRQASPSILAQVFTRAAHQRRANRITAKDVMARSIPVFRALCELDKPPRYHRNLGQLGYALKDQEPPDLAGAEAALTEAIAVRDANEGGEGYRLYEYNRALCRIARAPADGETEPTLRAQIYDDITAGRTDPAVQRAGLTDSEGRINAWLTRNGLT
jgi:hypothetical protein